MIPRARRLGIFGSWSVWATALILALTTQLSQVWVIALWILGLAPYVVAIQLVEPWLRRRLRGETPD